MNRKHFLLGLATVLVAGCKSTPPEPEVKPETTRLPKRTVRSNCYSLLHDLLGKQRHLSKILIIKQESPALKDLIKRIADTSARGDDLIKNFAQLDQGISLEMLLLPPGETATRDAIADTRTQELLHSSGKEFKANILFTQSESMGYAWHLCKVAAVYEPNAEWSRQLKELSQDFKVLQHEVVSMIRSSP
ncbi:MAG TPA: hypothetical protein VGH19_12525 [Verrucomicrobiae bacterium]